MNEQQLISHIEELGLSNKEARVYVACLKVGPSPVQRIADQSGIKRVTTYVILESLVGLGLVSQSIKGKKTYFIAEEPLNLQRLIQKREQELKEQKVNFDQILPELNGLKSIPKESPNVKFYDSADGIKSIMETFLSGHKREPYDCIYGISNLDQLYAFFPEFKQNDANPQRVKLGIPSRMLYTSSEGPIFAPTDPVSNRESRWVPLDKHPLNGDITIVGHHIVMLGLSGNKPIGVTIDSEDISRGLLELFNLAWENAKQYNQGV
ncbi:MAG TPA: helix-turn-helix domain-containing protein [Candidatus Saccharimonadia bacterium]|nr:helix-turn-helix domain-containing protein [Candidatus Saccharimonadia bacterium]